MNGTIKLTILCGVDKTGIEEHVKVDETVKFIPTHCMMQKVHSGIVVGIEDRNIRIEAIDLKVW